MIIDNGGNSLSLTSKPLSSRSGSSQVRQQHFNGYESIQGTIKAFENCPHAAIAQEPDNLVRTDPTKHAWIVGRPEQRSQALANGLFRFGVFVFAVGSIAAERGLEILPPGSIAYGRFQ